MVMLEMRKSRQYSFSGVLALTLLLIGGTAAEMNLPESTTYAASCSNWACPRSTSGCFMVVQHPSGQGYTWSEAEELCAEKGGHLPVVHNREEHRMLKRTGCFGSPAWLGLHRDSNSSEFRWRRGGALPHFTDFKCPKANNYSRRGCVVFDADERSGSWVMENCEDTSLVSQVVCQKGR